MFPLLKLIFRYHVVKKATNDSLVVSFAPHRNHSISWQEFSSMKLLLLSMFRLGRVGSVKSFLFSLKTRKKISLRVFAQHRISFKVQCEKPVKEQKKVYEDFFFVFSYKNGAIFFLMIKE